MKKPLAVLITAFSLSLGLTPAFIGISGNLIIDKKSSVKCEKYHWFLCSLFFTISILLFCAYSTTF